PLFQSGYTPLGWCRDAVFGPLGRAPGARGAMLSILTGEAGHRPTIPLAEGAEPTVGITLDGQSTKGVSA
ncbi:MAG: hypothetical protein WBW32_02860, partial [Luteibacter sp.]